MQIVLKRTTPGRMAATGRQRSCAGAGLRADARDVHGCHPDFTAVHGRLADAQQTLNAIGGS
ncbi:hypothetical protein [Rubrivivax gelatinosus]|uniref:hypothetical protein n=1 Tax=Rubrivivax gelatinosus TaxID=28068 RepID=UPI0010440F7E|nr:hypothetical protein [Rubrivivax gelatinosus]